MCMAMLTDPKSDAALPEFPSLYAALLRRCVAVGLQLEEQARSLLPIWVGQCLGEAHNGRLSQRMQEVCVFEHIRCLLGLRNQHGTQV